MIGWWFIEAVLTLIVAMVFLSVIGFILEFFDL